MMNFLVQKWHSFSKMRMSRSGSAMGCGMLVREKTIVKRSFTLVETLVAISIIMITILGPFNTIQNALIASYVARDELIGDSLAQEGVEYVRSVRDGDYLYTRANPATALSFLAGIDGTANGTGTLNADCVNNTCAVDPVNGTVTVCPGGVCSPLYVDSVTGLYTQAQGSNTVKSAFTRNVQLCYIGNGGCTHASNEVKVTVHATWSTEGRANSATVTDYLQNWL